MDRDDGQCGPAWFHLLAFYAGADEASHSLINTSVWDTLEHAQQMDRFAPMLELGKRFAEAGVSVD
jgi:hypothetical protein